jgi:DNA-binding CsgD family transcriptional regulator
LFVGELVRLLGSGDDHTVPHSVRELIAERFARLPEVPQRVIEVAAVLGRDFGYAPVAAALTLPPLTVIEALQDAVDARLVSVDVAHPGGYRFKHVMAREAVLDGMAESRRVHLHALAVAALRDTGWAQASDLAEHALRARAEIGELLVATLVAEAAEDAARMLAWEDAARWWRLMVDSPLADLVGVNADELRLRIGYALLSAGRGPEARACFEESAERARRTRNGPLLAAGALAVGDTAAEVATDAGLLRLLDLALGAPDVPPALQVRLLARRAMATYWSPDGGAEARRGSAAAVKAGRELGDEEALGAALVARQFVLRGPDALAERIEAGEAVRAIAVRMGDEQLRFRAIQWLIPDRFQAGELGLVHELLAAAREIARISRDPMQRWWVAIFDGMLSGFVGNDEQAERIAGEAAALGRRLGLPAADVYAVGQLVPVFWRAGRLAELQTRLDDVADRFPRLMTLQCDRALVLAETGKRTSARRWLARLCADEFAELPRDSLFVASLAILAATAVTLDDDLHAHQLLSALGSYPERNLIQGVPSAWGSSEWHLARLARVVGDQQAAERYAATSQKLHEKWGAARPGPTRVTDASIVPTRPLTQRESTVLHLLAEGRSNKEIAEALTISVHTAERHIANIFGKLGVRNRTEATAWAHRLGVDAPPA